ncbi:MAG: hypothetical protein M1817_003733 [Caeruleum heppii]|nr:MAG: hypothetical protein M1817_003733 [Caeruleum heppii]
MVVLAAFSHATTTLFGTICLSTFLALLVRLPLLVLPRRLVAFLGLFSYAVIPSSISALTSPLTLSYAAIHSQPLRPSATHLGAMPALAGSSPLITSLPSRHSTPSSPTSFLLPYRLAQLLLHATRLIMALALGFGGWISTARTLSIQSGVTGIKGSLYAYVVGLIAGAIGWGVLGAMEGVIGGVLDAALVCWASEGRGGGGGRGGSGGGGGGYCLEAEHLFGGGL